MVNRAALGQAMKNFEVNVATDTAGFLKIACFRFMRTSALSAVLSLCNPLNQISYWQFFNAIAAANVFLVITDSVFLVITDLLSQTPLGGGKHSFRLCVTPFSPLMNYSSNTTN